MFRNNFKRTQNKRNCGFTIVEMVVIIPLIIVLVGVFITTIIGMTGDVLGNRASNVLSYDIQSALDRISNDVTRSGAFLSANNIGVSSPQVFDDDDTGFTNVGANGTMLILNEYTTTQDPLNSSREPVYVSYKPYSCSSEYVSENQTLMVNIVYFVKDNALWRRVIAPSNYISLGCSTPYQQPTCGAPGVSGTLCKTEDIKVIDDVEAGGFSVEYYPNPNSDSKDNVADDPSKTDSERQTALSGNNTVKVTLNVARTVAGREFSQTSSIRSVSQNNNPDATFPDCPTGFIIVPGSDTYGTSDFCVMKYEAKQDSSTVPISQASGAPWTSINQTDASTYSQNVADCTNCHLITEAEWLTIAENIVKQSTNWDSGTLYSGHIYTGSTSGKGCSLAADPSDSDFDINETSPAAINRRIHYLSTGEWIWDFSGNVWEWTSGQTSGRQPGNIGEGTGTREYNAVTNHGLLSPDPFPSYTGISGAGSWTGVTNYIGKLITNADDTSLVGFLRGASCGEMDTDAGIYTLQSFTPSSAPSTVGFRVTR
ncbi:MAG: SUMF1/EgtB/PvdO family nonheme iron enzyme [Candidatus Saccharimonadaceae bacterium]|nr:SUMF1/EgtB/PvdO family nonheme iron enzyme [Candidatus Saccharimonadaceae bacterium]